MKTTIELPDALYRKAKAIAALSDRTLNDLIEQGLRLSLRSPSKGRQQRSLAELMAPACGVIESGVPDLGSNPRRLRASNCGEHDR